MIIEAGSPESQMRISRTQLTICPFQLIIDIIVDTAPYIGSQLAPVCSPCPRGELFPLVHQFLGFSIWLKASVYVACPLVPTGTLVAQYRLTLLFNFITLVIAWGFLSLFVLVHSELTLSLDMFFTWMHMS